MSTTLPVKSKPNMFLDNGTDTQTIDGYAEYREFLYFEIWPMGLTFERFEPSTVDVLVSSTDSGYDTKFSSGHTAALLRQSP